MPEAVILFKDLPATFPEHDKYKKPSVVGSLLFHSALILAVLLVPLLLPQSIPQSVLLVNLVSPLAPPPAAAPPPPIEAPAVNAAPQLRKTEPVLETPGVLFTPAAIPREIARVVEEPAPPVGVIAGVPGGVPGGVAGGVLGGILAANAGANMPDLAAPLPPPPPPPPPKITAASPVRVGGDVKEPRLIRMVPPVYPPLASKARVSGMVILEATITDQGTVEAIRVVSGHPLLIEAAIACVKQWQYEPTMLNGAPVSVILTAKVRFERAPHS